MNWLSLTTAALVLIVWEAVTRLFAIPPYIFPSPILVATQLVSSASLVISNTEVTALESFLGAIAGCLAGFAIGRFLALHRWAQSAFLPYVVGSNAIPVVAIAPLITLWFGNGLISKVVVAAFLCFFPIAINTYDGLKDRGGVLSELFHTLGASKPFSFWNLRLPLAVPYIVSGAKVSVVLAVIGAVVAEFVSSGAGLGFGMVQASYSLDTPRLFGYTIVAGLLGLSFYGVMLLLERLLRRSRRWTWAFRAQD